MQNTHVSLVKSSQEPTGRKVPRGRCWELSSRKVQRIVGKLPDVDLRALGSKVLQGAPTDKPEIFP